MNSPLNTVDVGIVGGGAAGLAAAIFTARAAPGATVVILDGARKLGAKILVSGGGRCNVTNRVVLAEDFCGGSRNVIKRVLASFPAERTVAFFRELGVEMYEEEDSGKLFPTTDRAKTVLAALVREANRLGVRVLTQHKVSGIERTAEGFAVEADETRLSARRVVLATGGQSLPKTGSDGSGYALAERLGHTLVPRTPALAPLVLEGDAHVALSGISQMVELRVEAPGWKARRVRGILLWTHFGVSGPAVLDASRHWHRAKLETGEATLAASFLPGDDVAAAEVRLLALAVDQPRVQLHNALARLVPARVSTMLLGELGIAESIPMAHVSREIRRRVASALVRWVLPVRDSRGYAFAEATAGGVPLSEIDPRSLESRQCPSLYLIGEVLDVDGRIGGFNFQWAWSSAFAAAGALARAMRGST